MFVDGRLVLENELLVRTVGNRHQIHVRELRPTFTPVRVRQNVMPANLLPGFDLSTGRNPPVEKRVVSRHPLSAR